MDIFQDLPRLIPMWHGLILQDVNQRQQLHRFTQDKLPDYGGVGIDINIIDNDEKCQVIKHAMDQAPFGAHACSLPFLPPNKVSFKTEPCLAPLEAAKAELERFCVTLDSLRRSVNKIDGKIRKEILSAQKIVTKMCSSGKFRKFPIPDSIVRLATEFPMHNTLSTDNFYYLGGCLAASQTVDGIPVLLYPTGKKLKKLALTTLEEICDSNKTFKDFDTKTVVTLNKGCIGKIKSAVPGYCFVQQGESLHFVNFVDTTNILQHHCSHVKNSVNIAGSPYNPVELISVFDTGNIELHDIETRQNLWLSNNTFFTESVRHGGSLACDFGPHPKSVLSLTDKYVHSYDLRLKGPKSVLYANDHFSSFPEERLMTLKNFIVNPFQHLISSTHHLYVCDERYPSKPVLMWNHLLKSSPLYCDIINYDSDTDYEDTVVILGTQKSRQLISFAVRSQHSQVHPISLNPPLFLSSPTDFANSLKLHGVFVNSNVEERLLYPLVGACAVAHNKTKGFTAFQLSSVGDLFFQDFEVKYDDNVLHHEEKTYCVDMGCVLVPPDQILPHLENWTDIPMKNSKNGFHSRSNFNNVNIDLKDILRALNDDSSGCCFCQSNNYRSEDDASNHNCSLCDLNTVQREKLSDAFKNLTLLSGPVCENSELSSFDTNCLFQFNDSYSIKLLEPWKRTEDTDASTPRQNLESVPNRLSSKIDLSFTASSQSLDKSTEQEFNTTQQSSQEIFFMDKSESDLQLDSQEHDDIVLSSQSNRSLIGETLRMSDSRLLNKKKSSIAGF